MPGEPTACAAQEPSVVQLFEEQAARWPERTAVVGEDGSLTYAELEELTRRLAGAVRVAGASADHPVAVLMDRGVRQLAALIGILRAGATYVCIDTGQPEARQRAQLANCRAAVVLSDRERPGVADGPIVVNGLDAPGELPGSAGGPVTAVPPPEVQDLAYVLYTSGSSGTPKGVAVTHGGLVNYAVHLVELLGCAESAAAFASVTSLSTDLGNTAVFPALISGGCLHLVSTDVARDPVEFAEYMQEHAIDHLKITPSHLAALLEYPDPDVLPRKALLLGGEALRWGLVDTVRRLGKCRVLNHYGPTEATVGALLFEVGRAGPDHRAAPTVPIGRPLAATAIHVVDTQLRPVPQGDPGELLIAGAGLARGYWNAPEETAARFRTLADGTRVYRTGDRVRQLTDGTVEFLSRIDSQVKIRGYRVEPGEVEAVLHEHPQVVQVAVVAVQDTYVGAVLSAYVVATGTDQPEAKELSAHLAASLPTHMVPSTITFVERLPFTPSGKVDHNALVRGQSVTDLRRKVDL
ncbi:amino acid adenylation domain-containing protein [Streptomyces sp. NPDC059906]|uniref:amino acid adenylation domain-containing protein n=1 Tax=Streptomyces sp. NPDC059906 TaxID=3346997 RepID=UPI003662E49F